MMFFFLIGLSGQTDPIIVIEIAKSAYWVKVNGSRPNNHITIAKKLKIADFRPKVASRNLSKKGVIFSRGFWRWDSPLLLGQWFQVIKNSLSWRWLALSKDGTVWHSFFFDHHFSDLSSIRNLLLNKEVLTSAMWLKKKKIIESVCFEYRTTS